MYRRNRLFYSILCLLLLSVSSFAVTLSVESGQGKIGSSGNVISLDLVNDVAIQGIQLKMADIPDFLVADTLVVTDRTEGYQISYSDTMGVLTIVLWSMSGSIINAGEGPIVDIVYQVSENARLEDVQISIFQEGLFVIDAERNSVPVTITDGTFIVTHVGETLGQPETFSLHQNFPNPFNPETTIPFTLARDSAIQLVVYNTIGQQVKTLYDGFLPSGDHDIKWNGRDHYGRIVPAGIYILRLESGTHVATRTVVLLK